MQELLAGLLVAAIRHHVCCAFTFITEVFGDDIDELHEQLAFIATGDPLNARKWWAEGFDQIYVKGGDWNGES